MKKLILALLLPCTLFSMDSTKIHRSMIRSPKGLGEVGASFDSEGFIINSNGSRIRVHAYDVDKSLRAMNAQRLEAIRRAGATIAVSKLSNGDFAVRMNPNLQGGLVIGAQIGFWTGKVGVHVISQAVIGTISTGIGIGVGIATANPGAGYIAGQAAWQGITAATLPVVEATSNVVALGTGIGGAVITGPIG